MKRVHRLPPREVAQICAKLLGRRSPMTADTLNEDLAEIEWVVSERENRRPIFWLSSTRHPRLLGRAEASQSDHGIQNLVLGTTGPADELDGGAQEQLDGAAEYLFGTLPCWLSPPDASRLLRQSWSGYLYDVEIGREINQVSVMAQRRTNKTEKKVAAKRTHLSMIESSALLEGTWTALSLGLGRMAGRLQSSDVVMLGTADCVSMDISRDGDRIWVLAAEEEGLGEPTALSEEQAATLTTCGFHPPLGDQANHSPQREAWWIVRKLPLDEQTQRILGHLTVTVLRRVYGARQPNEVMVAGPAVSVETQRVIDSLTFEIPEA